MVVVLMEEAHEFLHRVTCLHSAPGEVQYDGCFLGKVVDEGFSSSKLSQISRPFPTEGLLVLVSVKVVEEEKGDLGIDSEGEGIGGSRVETDHDGFSELAVSLSRRKCTTWYVVVSADEPR